MRLVRVFVAGKGRKRFLLEARIASGFEKVFGIMFSRARFVPLVIEFGVEVRALNAIHSFFCPEFDAVFLDARKRVVDVKPRVKPFTFSVVSRELCKFVLELPAGCTRRFGLRKGLKLFWR